MSKPMSTMSLPELIQLADDFQIDLPEVPKLTKAIVKKSLEEAGINNKTLKMMETKEAQEQVEPDLIFEGMCVVCMDRTNLSFGYKQYRFTQGKKYVLMPEEDAKVLIEKEPGFRRASKEEVMRYYRV